ncbi:FABP family protein [Glycomyces buryatensis]|uniref:Peroxynitrite isomerase n=1 Tax=Glycomyces buryatensis TaxID=2570927 RepID=A0A4S8QJD3_9ACTN|nr:FABP family protein [Glycomyces buryatensis]THV43372.1 FABP family protein [Glycomyces buryatensis]
MSEREVPEEFASTFAKVEPYPFEETDDLREGPNLHDDLLALLPLVGRWRGRGQGGYPGIDDFMYGQEMSFTHDGRPFLKYSARAWLIDEDGKPIRPAAQETGWWRVVKGEDPKRPEVEVLLAHPTGILDLYYGHVDGTKIEIATDAVVRSPQAKEVTAGKRLYGIVEGALMYAQEMAAEGNPMTPHLSARLGRISG